MKKVLSFVLVLILCFSLAACGDEVTVGPPTAPATTTQSNTTTTTTSVITSIDNQTTTVVYPTTSGKNDGDITTTTTKKPSTTGRVSLIDRETALTDRRTMGVNIYPVTEGNFDIGWLEGRVIEYKGTIVIGNTMPSTGAYASVGVQFNQGLQAYINAVNYNGGIGGDYENGKEGYYIYFINYDDGGNETAAYNYTKDLIDVQLVYALVGMSEAATTGATIDYIKQSGIIACYFKSASAELFNTSADTVAEGSRLFPVQPISATEGRIIVGQMIKQHPNTKMVGIVYTDDTMGNGVMSGAKAQIESMGAGYSTVICKVKSTADVEQAVETMTNCDAVIVVADRNITIKTIGTMIEKGVYKPVFLPTDMAASYILTSVQSEYLELEKENRFPIYSNVWMSSSDIDGYYEFCADVMSYTGDYSLISSTYAMEGWMAAKIFCEGIERILASGKKISDKNYVEAMESAPIAVPMCKSDSGDSLIDYADGVRIGVTTMGLIKSSDTCNYFVEVGGMQDYTKFLQTGKVSDIK